jgi:hypothetical protein
MTDFRTQLAHRFRKQQEFADGYSPLSARLFGIVADWLEAGGKDELVDWLLDVGNGRAPLDITLLLLAGLHRDVLNQEPETAGLAAYYPTVGGILPHDDSHLPQILCKTILARREQLTPFIQTANVQTNETARGVCWLLPVFYTGWKAVHLVDLGASAGLNLVAEARNYRILFGDQLSVNGKPHVDVGSGKPVQFSMQTRDVFPQPPNTSRQLQILSRTGCDLMPFPLATTTDEQTLAAFIWADHPQRLTRLREGIIAFRLANQGHSPIHLHPVRLPDDLPEFLEAHVPKLPNFPIVIYNTIITMYLDDQGHSLRQPIADWAAGQNRPVLWLQWEPLWDDPEPPEYGWIAWTADLWQAREHHHHWHLAWTHPHGTPIHWLPDLHKWASYWQEKS